MHAPPLLHTWKPKILSKPRPGAYSRLRILYMVDSLRVEGKRDSGRWGFLKPRYLEKRRQRGFVGRCHRRFSGLIVPLLQLAL